MGRADQTTKIRGMFVHPGQVNEIAKRFPGGRARAAGGDRRDGQRRR
jgi:phenylacetate-CoA ligase